MTVFDVYVNDRKICRAGVGRDGVLDAIVSWVKLIGPAARQARRLKSPLEETRLHVGGLRDGSHRKWPVPELKIGDRVTIQVLRAEAFDPPGRVERPDPARNERQEKRYYVRLKRKFEGPRSRRARPAARLPQEDETTLLNVDLDIWSRTPLEPLVAALGKRVYALHVGKEGRRYGAHLELARSGHSRGADGLIRDFVSLVRKLPPRSRALWNRAQARDFNVGVQAGVKPFSYELPVEPQTLHAAAGVNARVVLTVYAPSPAVAPARRRRS
ncbi:MAG TPA: hypothetical protein VES67_21005 [Vicinamibacterales bacterium]|nr:hypothetical protein [Vicinamibacterales bacterium]